MPVETLIQVRRGTNTNWSTVNPTLSSGEFGFESNTGRLKIGNGSQAWNVLPYLPDTLDALLDVIITSPLNGQLLQFNGTNWVNATPPTGEPIGHTDKTQSVMSFDKTTRTFSISPASASFEVWCVGQRFTFTTTQSVQIPNTSGLYYIYFSSSGVLSQKTTFFTWDADAPTAYVYWNATDGEAYFFADERHGITLDWQTHEYLHRTRGAAYASGFSIGAYTITGTGSANADMQLDIADGTFFDEDLQVDITHSASPTANTWQQVLQGGAEIPIFYRSGSVWKRTTPTKYPLKQGTLAQYNLNTAGTWSTPDLATNKYGVTWIVATNNLNYPVIGIMGQNQYDNLNKVAEDTWAALDLANLPIFEIRPLWKVSYLVSSGFTNTPKAAIREVVDLRVVGSTATGLPVTPTDHGSLYGLSDDDHTQYFNQTRGDARYLQLTGGTVTGTVAATTFSGSGASLTSIPNSATTATSANTASAIVARDASGNFTAGTITATLNGAAPAGSLTGTTLAAGITASSLTGVGTITTGTWSGSFGAVSGANLTSLNASNLGSGTVPSARISGAYTGITSVGTLTGLTVSGGSISLNNATSNMLDLSAVGAAAPAFTTRSVGTKIILWNGVSASAVDYAIGIEGNTQWFSVPTTSQQFKWYGGTTNIATLSGSGALTVGGAITLGFNGAVIGAAGGTYRTRISGGTGYTDRYVELGDYYSAAGGGGFWTGGHLHIGAGGDVRIRGASGDPTSTHFRVDGSGNGISTGAFYASNWFRSYGSTGWYNETHGGGIWMDESTTVKVYNGKAFLSNGITSSGGIYTSGGGYSGRASAGYGPFAVDNRAPALLSGAGTNWIHFNWDGALRIYVDSTLVKTFVIDHPNDEDKYLVHACAEGPTADVFYRGEGQLVNGLCVITLPNYFESLTELEGRTVMVSPIIEAMTDPASVANVGTTAVVDGKFKVYMTNGAVNPTQRFFWRVDAVRKNTAFSVEPDKATTQVGGDGPYTYIINERGKP